MCLQKQLDDPQKIRLFSQFLVDFVSKMILKTKQSRGIPASDNSPTKLSRNLLSYLDTPSVAANLRIIKFKAQNRLGLFHYTESNLGPVFCQCCLL